jgi:hypothetical protein
MSKVWLGISAIVLMTVGAARADDITAKKVFIKDNADPTKRQVQVQSADPGVNLVDADNPGANGASLHVYSATDDFCAILAGGPEWQQKPTKWKYKNKATRNAAQVKEGKLSFKIKSNVTYTLADNGTQGTVNVQAQFGTGTRFCMRCTGNKKDDASKFFGKDCAAAPCDPEPSTCNSVPPTTTSSTTSTVTTTSTTNTTQPAGTVLQGVLAATTGLFNYNATLGVPGSNAACNSLWPGSHTCTYADLQSAETAGDLVGRNDTNGMTVTSFWAIDSTHANVLQCTTTVAWDYQTAHTGHYGEKVNLANGTGTLGPLQSGLPDNVFCAGQSWVGCCL